MCTLAIFITTTIPTQHRTNRVRSVRTYGFGKRICLGRWVHICPLDDDDTSPGNLILFRHIANNSLFINIATILFCLEIEADKDCPPDVEKSHNTGLVVYVLEFSMSMIF